MLWTGNIWSSIDLCSDHNIFITVKVCLIPRMPRVPREDCRESGGDHPVRAREEQVQ